MIFGDFSEISNPSSNLQIRRTLEFYKFVLESIFHFLIELEFDFSDILFESKWGVFPYLHCNFKCGRWKYIQSQYTVHRTEYSRDDFYKTTFTRYSTHDTRGRVHDTRVSCNTEKSRDTPETRYSPFSHDTPSIVCIHRASVYRVSQKHPHDTRTT